MKKPGRKLRCALLLLCTAAALAADSRWHLQTSRYELSFGALPPALDGFRIVLLSDLHGASFGRDNGRLARAVLAAQPDLIALCGDFVDGYEDLPAAEALLRQLHGAAPVAWVSGNHDWAGGALPAWRRSLDRWGVLRMENRFLPLFWNGARLILAGVEDPNGPADMIRPETLAAQLREAYPDDFVLWLAHRNDWLRGDAPIPADLILCGHAHGGVIRLPFVGGLIGTGRRLGADFENGVYRQGGCVMLVSRGLGSSSAVPRLLNRPEIVVVTLHSGQEPRIE
ncbi:MAG: metallophosphoesterase [Oscillospiraceae bacterium]|nr:metallophosphoesterase [Oscillospiraceae bacterium]